MDSQNILGMTLPPIEDEKMKKKKNKKKEGWVRDNSATQKGIKGGQNIKENKVCLP
jgi:hypothetical protein